jgi:hypothetical protein
MMKNNRMYQDDVACLVCPHAVANLANVKFVCRSSEGWAAACSEACLDASDERVLGMVHLSHLAKVPGLPHDFYTLPIGFSLQDEQRRWKLGYFDADFVPESGDFLAPDKCHKLRHMRPEENVFVYTLENREFVVVTLDEGTVCLPFWREKGLVEKFAKSLRGHEDLIMCKLAEVVHFAKKHSIYFLAPDFLSLDYDFALLAHTDCESPEVGI